MKKVVLITLVLVLALSFNAYALDNVLYNLRNQIFSHSEEIRSMMPDSTDVIFLTGMFDSCIITTTQLDAYFIMLGIFNEIKKEDLTEAPLDLLINWLTKITNSNNLSIQSISLGSQALEQETLIHLEKLKTYYNNLNKRITDEMKRIGDLKRFIRM